MAVQVSRKMVQYGKERALTQPREIRTGERNWVCAQMVKGETQEKPGRSLNQIKVLVCKCFLEGIRRGSNSGSGKEGELKGIDKERNKSIISVPMGAENNKR